MKKVFLFLAVAAAMVSAGCSKDWTKEVPYACGITTYEGSFADLGKMEAYIKSIDVPLTPTSYIGKGKSESAAVADADEQAKKACAQLVARFKADDIAALGLTPSASFTWSMSRYADPANPFSEELVVMDKFDYPAAT